ncbi:MAG: hypothetical protein MRZ79_16905 [Bacteroidia bacterium]|nr:hypothetical protein [Bacteroidia bacterium]
MNTFDLIVIRILIAACSLGFVLFYFFPFLLALPALLVLGAFLRGNENRRLSRV